MPTYVYACRKCQHRFEQFQKISDDPIRTCEKCAEDSVERIPSAGIGLHFQGTGFYATDYNSQSKEPSTPPCNKPGGCGCH